eukprot:SAG11_NODE_896_length_6641_cov_3.280495_2_plen_516_part_00
MARRADGLQVKLKEAAQQRASFLARGRKIEEPAEGLGQAEQTSAITKAASEFSQAIYSVRMPVTAAEIVRAQEARSLATRMIENVCGCFRHACIAAGSDQGAFVAKFNEGCPGGNSDAFVLEGAETFYDSLRTHARTIRSASGPDAAATYVSELVDEFVAACLAAEADEEAFKVAFGKAVPTAPMPASVKAAATAVPKLPAVTSLAGSATPKAAAVAAQKSPSPRSRARSRGLDLVVSAVQIVRTKTGAEAAAKLGPTSPAAPQAAAVAAQKSPSPRPRARSRGLDLVAGAVQPVRTKTGARKVGRAVRKARKQEEAAIMPPTASGLEASEQRRTASEVAPKLGPTAPAAPQPEIAAARAAVALLEAKLLEAKDRLSALEKKHAVALKLCPTDDAPAPTAVVKARGAVGDNASGYTVTTSGSTTTILKVDGARGGKAPAPKPGKVGPGSLSAKEICGQLFELFDRDQSGALGAREAKGFLVANSCPKAEVEYTCACATRPFPLLLATVELLPLAS